jgi:hypothetical protein
MERNASPADTVRGLLPVIEVLRPGDRMVLIFPQPITMAQAAQVREEISRRAPELRQSLILSGMSVLVQRRVSVELEDGADPGSEVLHARIPIDRALLATKPEGLVEGIMDCVRVGLEEMISRWPEND